MLLGIRHASEPDHVVAVTTLLASSPDALGKTRAAWLGTLWGLGHSFTLFIVGLLLMWLRLGMSARLAAGFELIVAFMLLVLGVRSIQRALVLGRSGDVHLHSHGTSAHAHSGALDHVHVSSLTIARRPLFIGVVHGLAGSGALTALAMANMPSFATAAIYIACFGLGSILGMAALAGLVGLPLSRLGRTARVQAWLCVGAGVSSVMLGVLWGWPLLRLVVSS
jgi:hypothetical protein